MQKAGNYFQPLNQTRTGTGDEIVIKFIAYNKDFFKYKWNIFDLVIVAVSILSSFSYFTVLRVLRIFRSARILNAIRSMRAIKAFRFIDSLNQLKTIFTALIKSIPGIIWTCLLLMIFFYIYAIVGTNSFGSDFPEYFGSLGRSLLTLFQVMSFDSWFSGITRPVLHVFPWAWDFARMRSSSSAQGCDSRRCSTSSRLPLFRLMSL